MAFLVLGFGTEIIFDVNVKLIFARLNLSP